MSHSAPSDPDRQPHAARREGDQISPVELIFDLVFVFALSSCARRDRGSRRAKS
ncbi:MAG TPA: hypothetical protein VEJ42_02500 [Streptosporangiaceae bacterium]|nr:hypothetical protein [Streptosporangiaceae bacterium]